MKVETLNIAGMMRNRRLSRAFANAGIADLLRTLGYKCEREGVRIARIDRWYPSSKLCSNCGAKNDTLALAMRDWSCALCGEKNDRDLNAAKNIRDAPSCGVKARGERVRPAATFAGAMLDEARIRGIICLTSHACCALMGSAMMLPKFLLGGGHGKRTGQGV